MQNKCLGVFLVVLVIPLVILSIVFFSTRGLLKSPFYKNILQKTGSYNKVSQSVVQSTLKNQNQTDDITNTILQNADANWYQANFEKNLDEFFLYVNGQKSEGNFSLDLQSLGIKNSLAKNSEIPPEAIQLIPDQLTFSSYLQFMTDLKKIYTQNAGLAVSSEIVQKDLENINRQIQQGTELQKRTEQNLANIKNIFYYTKLGVYIVYGLTLLILILIGIAARHYAPAIFRWVGEALVIPSFVISLILFFSQRLLLVTLNPLNTIKLSAETKQLLMPIYSAVISTLYNDVLKTIFVVGLIGLFLVIISYLLPKFITKYITA